MVLQEKPWMALVYCIEAHATNKSLTAAHFALHLHLCHLWLKNGSEANFSPHRDELMRLTRIKSRNTFSKLVRDLERLRLIKVSPSQSRVECLQYQLVFNAKKMTTLSINYSNLFNLIDNNIVTQNAFAAQNLSSDPPKSGPTGQLFLDSYPPDKKVLKTRFSKPTLAQVQDYFQVLKLPQLEAEKFYNYYESNGWRVGKAGMKNWQAAVRNWKLNIEKYKPHLKSEKTQLGLFTSNTKNYDEPL